MNLKKNALFYFFSSYNGTFFPNPYKSHKSLKYAQRQKKRIALYLFFKLTQAPQVVFLRGFFCFIGVIWTIYQKNHI